MEIEGRDALERRLREPGGNICVWLHLGNWEIIGIALSICGGRPAAAYRPPRNPYLDRFVRETRSALYPGGLFVKAMTGGAMPSGVGAIAAVNFLRNGGLLGFVCDQVDETGAFAVPFFSEQPKFTPAPAALARRVGARLWIMRRFRRDRRSRFLCEINELPVARTSDRVPDVRNAPVAMALQFERWIRETPEQWMWWLRRSMSSQRRRSNQRVPGAGRHFDGSRQDRDV